MFFAHPLSSLAPLQADRNFARPKDAMDNEASAQQRSGGYIFRSKAKLEIRIECPATCQQGAPEVVLECQTGQCELDQLGV